MLISELPKKPNAKACFMHYLWCSQQSPWDRCYSYFPFYRWKMPKLEKVRDLILRHAVLTEETRFWMQSDVPSAPALKHHPTWRITSRPPLRAHGTCQYNGCTKVVETFGKKYSHTCLHFGERRPHGSSIIRHIIWIQNSPLTLIKPSIAFMIIIKANNVKRSVGQWVL